MRARTTDDDRGQTPQDFAIGMSIFLLAVVTVLAFIPSIFTPFTAPSATVDGQADRAATATMNDLAVQGSSTTLNRTATETWFATNRNASTDAFATSLGLESYRSVNVSIVRLNGSNRSDVVEIDITGGNTTALTAGASYDDQPSSTMVRIVRIEGMKDGKCEPACRMVVRVW
jgi:hypothetical protein